MRQQVREYIEKYELIRPGQLVLAAVSGGRDSLVMLHLLASLRYELGFSLAAATFDHGLRLEAAEEVRFVEAACRAMAVPCYAGKVAEALPEANQEAAARDARYAFLRRTAAEVGAERIAVAHHALDQAETLLMHLLRGCGLEGLAAMAPQEQDIIRPLLEVLPETLDAYVAEHQLEFCTDESNFSPRYLRNNIRLQLIPQLQQYNPRLTEALSATAEICRTDEQLLDQLAEEALAELWLDEQQALEYEGLLELPEALARRVVRKAFALVAGESLSYEHTLSVLALDDEQAATLPRGWVAYLRGQLIFAKSQPPLPEYDYLLPLQLSDKWLPVGDSGWEYRLQKTDLPLRSVGPYRLMLIEAELPQLRLRSRRDGDHIPSQGRRGKKKLKELFMEQKIPRFRRCGWPILEKDGEIIFVPGLWRRSGKEGNVVLSLREKR
ncbi:MAG: tRNA lysidine(34) synthetase TilS [Firmicutes bacterium]|nr:tRNA lysidine(34) synthetase TilS [Bacillota bacterium]